MPLAYEMFRNSNSQNVSSTSDSLLPELVDKLAKIVLRSRISSTTTMSPRGELIDPDYLMLWRSGPPLHINIYDTTTRTLLERWVISYEQLAASEATSPNTISTQSDMVLLLQQVYSYTRLMPLDGFIASGAVSKSTLAFDITFADTPLGSFASESRDGDRIEFSSQAKLKVFRFNRSRDGEGAGRVLFEVVFDETCGGLDCQERQVDAEKHDQPMEEQDQLTKKLKSSSTSSRLAQASAINIPLSSDCPRTGPSSSMPLPPQRDHVALSYKKHGSQLSQKIPSPADPLAPLSPIASLPALPPIASSNLSSLFSSRPVAPMPTSLLAPPSPSLFSSTLGNVTPERSGTIALPSISPTPSFYTYHQNASNPTIALRRLSRLSISAMQQEENGVDFNSESENGCESGPSNAFAMRREDGNMVYYTSRRPPSWGGSNPTLSHPGAINIQSNFIEPAYMLPQRQRSSQHRHSIGSPGTFNPEMFGSLVGSYEESILNGRMSTMPSKPLNFIAQIGVLGHGDAAPKCPPHVNLTFPAYFYELAEGAGGGTPYVGNVDLEAGLRGNERSKRFPGGYRVPPRGQLQIVIKNPNKTAVKFFLIPYDFEAMPPGTKTFLRQKEYSSDRAASPTRCSSLSSLRGSNDPKKTLQYALQIQITRTDRGRYYLYKSMRVVFANRVPDAKEQLRVVVEDPGEPRFVPANARSGKKRRGSKKEEEGGDREKELETERVAPVGTAVGEYQ